MTQPPACETCRFWEGAGSGIVGFSKCRRNAPVTRDKSEYPTDPVWPVTHAFAWCGEHQPKEPKEQQK